MALRFVLDEDTRDNSLWHALQAYNTNNPTAAVDIIRVGDPLGPDIGTLDPDLVMWSVRQQRTIISHDKNTLISVHNEFVNSGVENPGLFIVRKQVTIPELIEFITLAGHCGEPHEYASVTHFIPP